MIIFREVETTLQAHSRQLREDYGVIFLAVFGSVARGEQGVDSDIDFIVQFGDIPTFDRYMNLRFFLEDLFHCRVDLITQAGIRSETRPFIEGDMRRVA